MDINLDFIELAMASRGSVISAVDKLYKLGVVYLHLYFVKLTDNRGQEELPEDANSYGLEAKTYLTASKTIGEHYRKLGITGRTTFYINEKLSWYFILSEDYGQALELVKNCKESYIKNTYALALMFSNAVDKYRKAERVLNLAEADNYNKAMDTTVALKAVLYKLSGQCDAIVKRKERLSSSGKYLLSLREE
ncbi:MAG: hypothetical protein PWQ60_1189 [Thermoanaerobacteraceae bacterium]|nr:hypothetical protein [Thermoanaerobacteraceae bacterium]